MTLKTKKAWRGQTKFPLMLGKFLLKFPLKPLELALFNFPRKRDNDMKFSETKIYETDSVKHLGIRFRRT